MPTKLEKALSATKESKSIEFKSEFDVGSNQDWCEIIKDMIAIANTGGGVILFGLDDSGNPTGYDPSNLLAYDPADITNKIDKYTASVFSGFDLVETHEAATRLAALIIDEVAIPIVFRKPGTYTKGGKVQKTAFKEGSVYFRHGAISAPGTTSDLERSFQRELNRFRKSLLQDMGKIVKAPIESEVIVVPKSIQQTASGAAAIVRLTTDPKAPIIGSVDFDQTHPYRQKELIQEVKQRIPKDVRFNSYDVTSIGYAHHVGDHPEFIHLPKFGSAQYSPAFVDWIVESIENNSNFLQEARDDHYSIKHR